MPFTVFPLDHFLPVETGFQTLAVQMPSGHSLWSTRNLRGADESRMDYRPSAAESATIASERAKRVELLAQRRADGYDLWSGRPLSEDEVWSAEGAE